MQLSFPTHPLGPGLTRGCFPCTQSQKKNFTGHLNAGYAIGLGFSPDGK
jgi:hypothetical protein